MMETGSMNICVGYTRTAINRSTFLWNGRATQAGLQTGAV